MVITLSFRIKVLKVKIAACLREVARGVLSYLDRLVCLEGELEKLETKPQATKQSKPVQLTIFDVMTPEQEYLENIQENKQANQSNRSGEFFWGFSSETAENKVIELCQKYKCQPSKELLQIAIDSINRGSKVSVYTLERNVKRALEHWERISKWEKESEVHNTDNLINQIMSEIENNGFSADLWEKHGKTRIYVYDCFGADCGYVDLTNQRKPIYCLNDDGVVLAIVKKILGL